MGFLDIFRKKKSSFEKYFEGSDVKPGPRHNYHFPKEVLDMVKKIELTFKKVHPLTFEEWIDGFDRDSNPEKEIALWLYMADVYKKIISKYPNKPDYNKEIYKVVLSCSIGDDQYVLSQIKSKILSKSEVISIIKEFRNK